MMESVTIEAALAQFPNFAGFILAIMLLYRAHMKALDTIQKQHDSILECYRDSRGVNE